MRTRIGYLSTLLGLLALLGLTGQRGAVARVAISTDAGRGVAVPPGPGDWPMYGHDPQRTNYNPAETTIGAGNVNQLVQRWQQNVGNNGTPGAAAPSVANGQVYVASSAASPASNFFVFDAGNGMPAWNKNIGYRSSCFNVGIGSTPAISGTTIVVGADNASQNPAYYGISTINGTVVWTNTMGVGASGFPWESPLIIGNHTYSGISSRCDNPSVRGEIRNLDLSSGSQTANVYFVGAGEAGGGIWHSPALSPDGTTLAIGTGEDFSCTDCSLTRSMVTLNATTLAVLQHHQEGPAAADSDFGTSPVFFHDSQNRVLVGAGHKNGTFYVYDIANLNGGALWTRSNGGTSVGLMPAYDPTFGTGGTLFIVNGSITALDPASNTVRWGPVAIAGTHGNIAIANGLIFVNGGASGLQIRSETDGSLLRTIMPANAGGANSGVAVANGFVYWLSGSYINAWSVPAGAPTATPTVAAPTATAAPSTSTPVLPTATRTATAPPTATPDGPTRTPPPPTATPGGPTSTPAPATGSPTPFPGTPGTPPPPPPTATPAGATSTPAMATATPCTLSFSDVHPSDYFYTPVLYLACHGVISGYGDGTFRPYNQTTRAQMVKIVVLGFQKPIQTPPASGYTFADVPRSFPFFAVIETAAADNIVSGYTCGGPGEPCDLQHRPYFRPYANVTRAQLAKIVVVAAGWALQNPATGTFADVAPGSTFYPFVETAACHGIISGYTCGGPGEPCDPQHRPYFRQANPAIRGQIAKIVYGAVTGSQVCAPPGAGR